MTGNDNRASPKCYGLLRGQIQVTDDFDAPLELAEFGMSDKSEVGIEAPDDVSAPPQDGRVQGEPGRKLSAFARQCAARPVEDSRLRGETAGYEDQALPDNSTTQKNGTEGSE